MQIEILSIGEELLKGKLNTNASEIARALTKEGFFVTKETTLSDDLSLLKEGLKEAFIKNDILIATGGLGPTLDDTTKRAISELFSLPLVEDKNLVKELIHRFGEKAKEWAFIPKGAIPISNPVGTACGLILEKEKKLLFFLPGVPYEMRLMLKEVLSFLKKAYPRKKPFTSHINFCLVNEIEINPFLEEMQKEEPSLSIGIYPHFFEVQVELALIGKEEKLALFKERLKKNFPKNTFEEASLEEALLKSFTKKKKTLILAESCTGGYMAHRLTSVSGSSGYFLGSYVTYSNALKEKLGVSSKTLEKEGAVSAETVEEMLKNAFHSGADFGASASGIAGPTGGTQKKPVGTVFIAVGERGKKLDIGKIEAPGDRLTVIQYTTSLVFAILWRQINHQSFFFHE